MVPVSHISPHSSRRLLPLLSLAINNVRRILFLGNDSLEFVKRDSPIDHHSKKFIIFACLIPILVILSGIFAGLTLGYMSLDETQLNVLSISGTPEQRQYANKIMPIRKNGHLLLVTLLLANMIVNESLPVISDPVLGGGVQSVAVSTVLIVIFSEIIPQSVCTRHGLYLGAKMAGCTKVLIYTLGIISWPVAKILEFVLGPHHGIIYRRAELKELIAMHSSLSSHGGDLKKDTVAIIGATLDLQEKVVKQAMTPISDVFMLSIDSNLDYALLRKICLTGHSRVPVYEEVEVPAQTGGLVRVKKIVGILLVKNCVLLDPKDAVPLRRIPLNKVPYVPSNEPLLGILDRFQEGRSHMAIVSRFSVEKAASIKQAVKVGLTQRLRQRVGMGDYSDEDDEDDEDSDSTLKGDGVWEKELTEGNYRGAMAKARASRGRSKRRGAVGRPVDLEMGVINRDDKVPKNSIRPSLQLEQSMPADAVLAKESAEEFLQSLDPAIEPLGIITLEDVLEELIGEEIYDEFDPQGAHGEFSYVVGDSQRATSSTLKRRGSAPQLASMKTETAYSIPVVPDSMPGVIVGSTPVVKPIPLSLKGLGFLRSRSAPPTPRDTNPTKDGTVSSIKPGLPVLVPVPCNLPPVPPRVPEDVRLATPPVILEHSAESPAITTTSPPDDETKTKGVAPPSAFPTTNHALPPSSRTASPAPSLEAILLDRKRRQLSQGSITSNISPVAPPITRIVTSGTPKGTRFKSSPLGATEHSGVLIAERVMENLRGETTKPGDYEDERIPDEKDKEGPDKS